MKQIRSFGMSKGITIVALSILISVIVSVVLLILKVDSFMISYAISFGLSVMIAILFYKKSFGSYTLDINKRYLWLIPLVIFLPILLQIGITTHIVALIPMSESFKKIFESIGSQGPIASFVTFVILAPILEEILCRGIILKGLLKGYSPAKAIVFSAFLFGIMHLNPWQFIGAFGIGLICGWVYYKTKNLILPILVHLSNNLFFTWFGYYFGKEYLIDQPVISAFGDNNVQLIVAGSSILLLVLILALLKRIFDQDSKKVAAMTNPI